jgi:sirohydrochlorin cobaltochelatase
LNDGCELNNTAILFFAHGSRDANWRRPFDAILADFRGMHATKLAELAFLEFMTPDFASAAQALVDQGATQIRVIPLFLAEGAHTRRDLGALLEITQANHPDIRFSVSPAIGEIDSIRSAISSWVATQL